jgi:acetyl esterase/lipase
MLKPRLAAAPDALALRKIMRPRRARLPKGIRITPGRAGGISGEWVETFDASGSTLLYLHGGGYVACSPETHRPITAGFAKRGFRVFAADYRLAPEHLFPSAVDDALAAYRALRMQVADPICVAGDSAGGGLTLALLLALRDAGDPLPNACVLFSPWTDLCASGESIKTNDQLCAMFQGANIGKAAKYYLGEADPRNPLASPLYGDLKGLPRLLIHVAEREVLLDDSRRFADRARATGVSVDLKIWPDVFHDWQLLSLIPEARQSLDESARFLRS